MPAPPPLLPLQRSLPHLPVPPLAETVRRYLESARQLQTPEEFEGTAATAAAFLAKEGPTLQWYLQLKSWFFDNYVWVGAGGGERGQTWIHCFSLPVWRQPRRRTDWWEQYVYLKGRSPIAVNSVRGGEVGGERVLEDPLDAVSGRWGRKRCSGHATTLLPPPHCRTTTSWTAADGRRRPCRRRAPPSSSSA